MKKNKELGKWIGLEACFGLAFDVAYELYT
jgi:hypothetical protein